MFGEEWGFSLSFFLRFLGYEETLTFAPYTRCLPEAFLSIYLTAPTVNTLAGDVYNILEKQTKAILAFSTLSSFLSHHAEDVAYKMNAVNPCSGVVTKMVSNRIFKLLVQSHTSVFGLFYSQLKSGSGFTI